MINSCYLQNIGDYIGYFYIVWSNFHLLKQKVTNSCIITLKTNWNCQHFVVNQCMHSSLVDANNSIKKDINTDIYLLIFLYIKVNVNQPSIIIIIIINLQSGLLIFCDVVISHNWPQIATFRIIRQKSHNSGKIAKFEERTRKYLLLT